MAISVYNKKKFKNKSLVSSSIIYEIIFPGMSVNEILFLACLRGNINHVSFIFHQNEGRRRQRFSL